MSNARDQQNASALLKLLGFRPPPPEATQPLQVVATPGLVAPDVFPVDLTVSVGSLTVDGMYYYNGSAWAALTTSVGTRALAGVCVSSGDASSVIRLLGLVPRSGTVGDVLWADAGALTTTYPGDETDETTGAPWVWEVGWQVDADHALIMPTCPYRPRLVRFCVDGGETALTVTVREYPADP